MKNFEVGDEVTVDWDVNDCNCETCKHLSENQGKIAKILDRNYVEVKINNKRIPVQTFRTNNIKLTTTKTEQKIGEEYNI